MQCAHGRRQRALGLRQHQPNRLGRDGNTRRRRKCGGSSMTRICPLAWLAAVLLLVPGCGGPPHISKANVKLIEQLRTAIAAKKNDWLAQAEKQIEEHRKAGTLSGDESEAVQSIID